MPRASQEVVTTDARHATPRQWLRAIDWLVGAGLHPRANTTTLAVARDLAGRMDYERGLVLYDLERTAARLGISQATLKRHVRVLRELGALAWHRHGTRRNLHLPGRKYAGTATIYAATIPPVYDAAMGHRLSGHGYEARVVGVTEAGCRDAVETARAAARPAANPPAGTSRSRHREPHSPTRHPHARKAEVSGELNDTPRKRAPRRRTRKATPWRSPLQAARDIQIARQVRPLVTWTQREGLRRLAYALRPLIDAGLDVHGIAAELHAWHLTWHPAQPAAYITATLRHRAKRDAQAPLPAASVAPTTTFQDAIAEIVNREARDAETSDRTITVSGDGHAGLEQLSRTEVIDLRSAAAADPGLVLTAIENLGEPQARRLYTNRLVDTVLLREYGGHNIVVQG
ncbi:cell wall protein [Streptomyces sp. O3]